MDHGGQSGHRGTTARKVLSVTATLPSTGDDTLSSLWLALFLVSAGVGTTALTRRRKS